MRCELAGIAAHGTPGLPSWLGFGGGGSFGDGGDFGGIWGDRSGRRSAAVSDLDSLRRLAVYCVGLAILLSVPSSLAFFAAFGGDAEAAIFGRPEAILSGGPEAAFLLRWAAILDMFYSYLLLIPLALFVHRRLRPMKPWLADIGAIGALAYIFVGASGAAILATVGSSLVDAHASAAPQEQAAIATSFDVLRNVVYFGLWQTLDPITAGLWVFSIGWLLMPERPFVGRLLVLVGVGMWGVSVMTMLGIHSLGVLLAGFGVVVLAWLAWTAVARRGNGASATA